ncbi:hypothetical protein ABK040_014729 [Willaertia magna]
MAVNDNFKQKALSNELDIDDAARISREDILDVFETNDVYGLAETEAKRRQAHVGLNELEEEEKETLFEKFIEKFKEPMILLLLGSAIISVLFGQYDDAISIALAVFIVCTVAFIQEWRSDKALESLKELTKHKATVLRDGKYQILSAEEVVPGDIVSFTAGERVPADVRLIEVNRLGIDESVFTGEVNPASKLTEKVEPKHEAANGAASSSPFPKATHVADCKNIAFMGTLVSVGNGKGVVVSTGHKTEIGKISDLLRSIEEKNTPLQDAMDDLSQKISYFSFGVIAVIFVIGVITGKSWLEMFQMGISLAVAAIPEGLPIVVTVTLAMGVIRMAKKKAIVRKLPSVESLGACNVVCVDKTGTLTKNEMTMTKIFTLSEPESVFSISGLGYQTREGSFYRCPYSTLYTKHHQQTGEEIYPVELDHLNMLFKIGVLCNNANIDFETDKLVGQPTEGALIVAAKKAKIDVKLLRQKYKKIDEVPFSSEHKWMAIKAKNLDTGKELYYVKGATENILNNCTSYYLNSNEPKRTLTDALRRKIEDAANALSENALRVMTLAYGERPDQDLIFVGVVGIYDPPRPGVKEAVKTLIKGGVKVVMITGDSMKTAVAIAKELNIVPEDATNEDEYALTVSDLNNENFEQKVSKARVFYRMAPAHKMKIVSAYQHQDYVVAMTGDGINDAPALKMADIGVAMGQSGTDVSKEASEMILADDNFPTILTAIEEGKSIFNNIKSFLRYQLTTSVSCMLIVIFCTFLGYPLPLNPMQILFINIIMDGPPAQSLGVEPVDEDVMNQPPRDTKKSILSGRMLMSVVISALIMVCGTLYVFITGMKEDGVVDARDITMTFTTFVFFQVFNALNCRSEKKSLFQVGLTSNTAFIFAVGGSALGQLALVYVPLLRTIFETEPLSLPDLLTVTLISSSVWIIEEIIKFFERKVEKQ